MMDWRGTASGDGPPLRVNVADATGLLDDLEARMAAGRGFTVATLNLDHAVKLRRDPAFRAAYAAHSHITADGRPVVWLSRLSGQEVKLVTGSDLVAPLLRRAARADAPVAFFGSRENSLEHAAQRLISDIPDLSVPARIAPPMGFDPEGPEAIAALDRIAASGARLCLVALGAPKQERFAALGAARHPALGFVSIGAGLDFLAGEQRRAPKIMRMLAAEWLWRLLSDPGRMAGRYAACAALLPDLTLRALRARAATPVRSDPS